MHPEDALLASTGRKQQQVVAESWLWAGGLTYSDEASGPVMYASSFVHRGGDGSKGS
jgi:hypothetical protein